MVPPPLLERGPLASALGVDNSAAGHGRAGTKSKNIAVSSRAPMNQPWTEVVSGQHRSLQGTAAAASSSGGAVPSSNVASGVCEGTAALGPSVRPTEHPSRNASKETIAPHATLEKPTYFVETSPYYQQHSFYAQRGGGDPTPLPPPPPLNAGHHSSTGGDHLPPSATVGDLPAVRQVGQSDTLWRSGGGRSWQDRSRGRRPTGGRSHDSSLSGFHRPATDASGGFSGSNNDGNNSVSENREGAARHGNGDDDTTSGGGGGASAGLHRETNNGPQESSSGFLFAKRWADETTDRESEDEEEEEPPPGETTVASDKRVWRRPSSNGTRSARRQQQRAPATASVSSSGKRLSGEPKRATSTSDHHSATQNHQQRRIVSKQRDNQPPTPDWRARPVEGSRQQQPLPPPSQQQQQTSLSGGPGDGGTQRTLFDPQALTAEGLSSHQNVFYSDRKSDSRRTENNTRPRHADDAGTLVQRAASSATGVSYSSYGQSSGVVATGNGSTAPDACQDMPQREDLRSSYHSAATSASAAQQKIDRMSLYDDAVRRVEFRSSVVTASSVPVGSSAASLPPNNLMLLVSPSDLRFQQQAMYGSGDPRYFYYPQQLVPGFYEPYAMYEGNSNAPDNVPPAPYDPMSMQSSVAHHARMTAQMPGDHVSSHDVATWGGDPGARKACREDDDIQRRQGLEYPPNPLMFSDAKVLQQRDKMVQLQQHPVPRCDPRLLLRRPMPDSTDYPHRPGLEPFLIQRHPSPPFELRPGQPWNRHALILGSYDTAQVPYVKRLQQQAAATTDPPPPPIAKEEPRRGVAAQRDDCNSQIPGAGVVNSLHQESQHSPLIRKNPDEKAVCRHFLANRCTFPECKFSHPTGPRPIRARSQQRSNNTNPKRSKEVFPTTLRVSSADKPSRSSDEVHDTATGKQPSQQNQGSSDTRTGTATGVGAPSNGAGRTSRRREPPSLPPSEHPVDDGGKSQKESEKEKARRRHKPKPASVQQIHQQQKQQQQLPSPPPSAQQQQQQQSAVWQRKAQTKDVDPKSAKPVKSVKRDRSEPDITAKRPSGSPVVSAEDRVAQARAFRSSINQTFQTVAKDDSGAKHQSKSHTATSVDVPKSDLKLAESSLEEALPSTASRKVSTGGRSTYRRRGASSAEPIILTPPVAVTTAASTSAPTTADKPKQPQSQQRKPQAARGGRRQRAGWRGNLF